ncbi:MAG: hypothetical protein ACLRQF_24425 [Thomasclavelia ramosa]
MKLFFMKDDLNELENYLSKRNYANLEELNIIVRKVSFMRTNDIGIEIKFKLIFNDRKISLLLSLKIQEKPIYNF